MSEQRALGRAHARLLLRSLPLVVALVGMTTALAEPGSALPAPGGPAPQGAATITVTPSSSLSTGDTVTVKITTTAATPADVFIGVTQCGNATTAGNPLTTLDPKGNDCAGAEGFSGGYIKLVGADDKGVVGVGGLAYAAGPVPAGTYTVNLKLEQATIGVNKTKCIPKTASVPLDCTIAAATATVGGGYTGPGYFFQATAPIVFGSSGTTTTTTTTTSNSSSTTSTSSTSSTTSTTVGNSTTSTTASRSALSVTPTTAATAGPTTTTTTATSKPSSALAFTGSGRTNLLIAFFAIALLDLGYLALSATRPGRRRLPRLRRGG